MGNSSSSGKLRTRNYRQRQRQARTINARKVKVSSTLLGGLLMVTNQTLQPSCTPEYWTALHALFYELIYHTPHPVPCPRCCRAYDGCGLYTGSTHQFYSVNPVSAGAYPSDCWAPTHSPHDALPLCPCVLGPCPMSLAPKTLLEVGRSTDLQDT